MDNANLSAILKQRAEDAKIPLHPDLLPYYSETEEGFPMVRHPLVYDLLPVPGHTNRLYEQKVQALRKAEDAEDWPMAVWLHERPYRLKALIGYAIGRDDGDRPIPLTGSEGHWVLDLVADVWVDSENIEEVIEDWRALVDPDSNPNLWLGTDAERDEFDALPWGLETPPDTVLAYRGGTVGDWSWTTSLYIAGGFAKRSGHPVRYSLIHKSECFGYLTRRGEAELLVRLTPERMSLVYPEGMP